MRKVVVALILSVCACTPSQAASGDAGLDGGRRDAGDGGDARAPIDAAPEVEETIPAASSDELTSRAKHLLEAIAHDNSELAVDILFPRDAYIAARDVQDAGKVWERKIQMPFKKTVHRLSKRPKNMEHAQFVSFEIGHAVLQATPKKRGWNKPLWTVRHSKLSFTLEGKSYRIDLSEMTAWHGSWYVTRLKGIE